MHANPTFVSLSVLRGTPPPRDAEAAGAVVDEFADLLRIDLRSVDPARAALGELERYVDQCVRVLPAVGAWCARVQAGDDVERQALATAAAALRPALEDVERAIRGIRGGDAEPRARALALAVASVSRALPVPPRPPPRWSALASLLR